MELTSDHCRLCSASQKERGMGHWHGITVGFANNGQGSIKAPIRGNIVFLLFFLFLNVKGRSFRLPV